jgi:hypothetical protein
MPDFPSIFAEKRASTAWLQGSFIKTTLTIYRSPEQYRAANASLNS